jgi:NAD(P)-dependent dehydrogenase (short-subunit alcohol dehydrogenase family)
MNLSFENKVALVTGAASGMGLATARAFAEAGAAIVLADFREDEVKAETQKLKAAGHKAIAIRCDVSDDAQVAAMVERTVTAGSADSTPPSTTQGLWPTSRRPPPAPAKTGTA